MGHQCNAEETRAMNAYEYADGFKGLNKIHVDGTDFFKSYKIMRNVINDVREQQQAHGWYMQKFVCLIIIPVG